MSRKNCSIEGKAKIVLNLLSDPAAIIDKQGRQLLVNDAFEEVTGLSQKEITGKPFLEFEILPAESKRILLENLMRKMQGLPVEPYEVYFTDKTGDSKCVEVKGRKISYAGQPADLVVFHDVTRRKENARRLKEYAEKMAALVDEKVGEIKESEEKFRNLAEQSPNMVFVNKKGRVVYANRKAEEVMGYAKEELYSPSFDFLCLIAPEFRERIQSVYERHVKDGRDIGPLEYRLITKDGRVLDAILTSKQIMYEGDNAILGTVIDITERKKAEMTLSESEEKYRNLVENSKDAVVLVDFKGNVLFANEAAETLTGYTLQEGKGMNIRVVTPKKLWPESIAMLLKARLGKVIPYFEYELKRKDGTIIPVETGGQAIFKDGKPVAIQIIARDITERKKAEEALRESEEKYRNLFENARDVILTLDLKGNLTSVNKAVARYGFKVDEVVGKNMLKFASKKYWPKLLEDLVKTTRGKPAEAEIEIITPVGNRFVEYSGNPLVQGKKVVGIQAVLRDVSERKEIEERVKESEEKYRKLFEESMDAIFVADAETGVIIDCNHAASELVGRDKSELVGKHQRILHPPEEIEGEFSRTFKQHIREKEGQVLETHVITKRGEIKDVAIKANVIELEDKKVIQGVFRDITEQKKMEADVEQKLDMLEALTENLGVGFGIISKDYRVLWVNKFIKNNAGDVEGKQCYSSLNTLDHICPDCGVRKVFEEGVERDSHEYSQIGVHGDMYHVELIATPLKDKDGNITAALEFVVDIAEKKRMQRQLTEYSLKLEKLVEQRTEQLQQTQAKLIKSERLAAIGELAGMVGHDLRNPLTSIKNAAYYLWKKQSSGSDDQIKKMLEVIDSSVAHADKIISDLQEYSREMHLEPVNCSPRSILHEALVMVQVPKQVKIIDTTQEEPVIKADKAKMVRVFINIVKNAVEAMPEGGTLQVKSIQTDGNVEISFADTGEGIPKEAFARLFSPLFTTKAQGMGFGLAICKRVVEAHQGRITVQSVEGKGSTFTVTIPIKPELENGGEKTWVNMPESLLSTTTKT
jgi:PAS domain S-box-containing protein